MAFKSLFIARAADADKDRHASTIQTDTYHLHTVVVSDQKGALEVSKRYLAEKGIHSVLLCPGFTHADVAEIAQAMGSDVSVAVARGDGPGSRAALTAMKREGFA